MKKVIYCNGCIQGQEGCCNVCSRIPQIEETIICDKCGIEIGANNVQVIVSNNGERTIYDFCTIEHAAVFINAELAKESK